MKITDRIILKTIDGKIIVRPLADKHINNWVEYSNGIGMLRDEGIEAWNNGEELEWWHFSFIGSSKAILHGQF